MDWTDPTVAVVPSLDGTVLAVLAGSNERITGREVHRRSRRGSVVGVSNALSRLVEQGVVASERAGPANLYWLNRDHVAAGIAIALAGLRSEFVGRIRAELATWQVPAVSAAVFGSVARGEGSIESDVDLLLIRPDGVAGSEAWVWNEQVDRLGSAIQAWSGNVASMLEVTRADLAALTERDAPVRRSLLEDAIDLGEHPIRDFLGDTGSTALRPNPTQPAR